MRTLASSSLAPLVLLLGLTSGAGATSSAVGTCKSITHARAGVGVAYKGTVWNDDYKVKVAIPRGLTAWGGVAPDAPFHGFVIFFPGHPQACVGFEIHLRVETDTGAGEHSPPGKQVAVGNAVGWEDVAEGLVDGVAYTDVKIRFSVPRGTEVYDGSVWMATPTADLKPTTPVFQDFVSHIRFGRR